MTTAVVLFILNFYLRLSGGVRSHVPGEEPPPHAEGEAAFPGTEVPLEYVQASINLHRVTLRARCELIPEGLAYMRAVFPEEFGAQPEIPAGAAVDQQVAAHPTAFLVKGLAVTDVVVHG